MGLPAHWGRGRRPVCDPNAHRPPAAHTDGVCCVPRRNATGTRIVRPAPDIPLTTSTDRRPLDRVFAAACWLVGMSEFVRKNTDPDPEPDAHAVDLVDGDEPPARILIRGKLPDSLEHDGRTWVPTGETHDADDAPPIAVFRPYV